ncbi:IclR family transcriptional regulator [Caballeronia mineralivorans]|jgi:IclR family acetate operon transcriptional repressor|uniref:IclR family transcriptional regulator n=1 Tax=Caballeronia mineralivorans TaxID=2010198 RepID=UPI0023F2EFF1|nr:IclR family transcriptional regulator [Caballeronia mineralivorans]MDB5786903.1 iclR helix-turn-helix domain protein [Caballeronia mineralivorans]
MQRPVPTRRKSETNVQSIIREDKSSVQVLLRALSLLEILAEDDKGYRLIDLAERTGLPASTVHRILTTLEQKRFVCFQRERALWYIGAQCFSVGAVFGGRRQLTELATPSMRRLRDVSGETVQLGCVDEQDMLLLLQVQSREVMHAASRPGDRSPLACTAMGKAVLAAMPDSEISAFVQHGGLQRLTPQSIARSTALHSELEEVRRVGYAIDNEETWLGVRCVAAAILDELSMPVAALAVVGSTLRVTMQRMEELGRNAILAAREISVAFGGRPDCAVLPHRGSAHAVPRPRT